MLKGQLWENKLNQREMKLTTSSKEKPLPPLNIRENKSRKCVVVQVVPEELAQDKE